ncbi:hypothetical protein [Methylobacter psychrophilus]|uniref:hypothetical protein n=1 Tax=Methylobacter psychrophilus TaxID=96941 RepID=UPI0021D4B97D|nr:hypothetical protein [Methylobacter psychrophilus]
MKTYHHSSYSESLQKQANGIGQGADVSTAYMATRVGTTNLPDISLPSHHCIIVLDYGFH